MLGRSSGINFVFASELCSWSSQAGLEAFINALAEDFPNRLYIWESTARGFGNEWYDMCSGAKEDETTQKLFFLGWFLKEDYAFKSDTPEFRRWWKEDETEEEKEIAGGIIASPRRVPLMDIQMRMANVILICFIIAPWSHSLTMPHPCSRCICHRDRPRR